jgi:hypothetical protein
MLRAAWDKRFVTVLESAWSAYEEDDHSDGASLQATKAPRNSHPRSRRNTRSKRKQRVCTRDEGIAIVAVMVLATQENPFVGMKRTVQGAHDYENDPSHARLRPMMKNPITTLVDQRIFTATKDSCTLTKREFAHPDGEMAH